MWFSSISIYSYFLIRKMVYLKMKSFSQNSHLWAVPNHVNIIQNQTRIQNSNLQCSMTNPYFTCLVHPKQCIQLTPLTFPPFYYGLYPKNPCEMKVVYNLLSIWLFHYSFYSLNLYVNQWFCTHLWLCNFDLFH